MFEVSLAKLVSYILSMSNINLKDIGLVKISPSHIPPYIQHYGSNYTLDVGI